MELKTKHAYIRLEPNQTLDSSRCTLNPVAVRLECWHHKRVTKKAAKTFSIDQSQNFHHTILTTDRVEQLRRVATASKCVRRLSDHVICTVADGYGTRSGNNVITLAQAFWGIWYTVKLTSVFSEIRLSAKLIHNFICFVCRRNIYQNLRVSN